MKYERGLSARLAAGFDRMVTRMTFGEPVKMRGLHPSMASMTHIDEGEGDYRIVYNPRDSGWAVPVQFPNGDIQGMYEQDIVHVYKGNELVERKRIKDKPLGFIVYDLGSREAEEAIHRGFEARRKLYKSRGC